MMSKCLFARGTLSLAISVSFLPFAHDYYSPLRPEELAWAATPAPFQVSYVSRCRSRSRRPLPESARPARRSSVPAWVWPKKKYIRHIRDHSPHTELDSRRENAQELS